MNRIDRMMLWGAWAVVVGGLFCGVSRISSAPSIEPLAAIARAECTRKFQSANEAAPPPLARLRYQADWGPVSSGQAPANPWAAFVQPLIKGTEKAPPAVPFFVLPYANAKVKGEIDRATITWSLESPAVELEPHEIRKPAPVRSILIVRQAGEDAPKIIAELSDPRASSYVDRNLRGRTTYRYRVLVVGDETVRTAPYRYCLATLTSVPGEAGRMETSSHVRVRLLGGDAGVAIVRWETYNGSAGAWTAQTGSVRPGERIGTTGWTLDGLRFYKFTLTADVTDEVGEKSVLSTKD